MHCALYIHLVAYLHLFLYGLLCFPSGMGATHAGGGERNDKSGRQRKTGQRNVLFEQTQSV